MKLLFTILSIATLKIALAQSPRDFLDAADKAVLERQTLLTKALETRSTEIELHAWIRFIESNGMSGLTLDKFKVLVPDRVILAPQGAVHTASITLGPKIGGGRVDSRVDDMRWHALLWFDESGTFSRAVLIYAGEPRI